MRLDSDVAGASVTGQETRERRRYPRQSVAMSRDPQSVADSATLPHPIYSVRKKSAPTGHCAVAVAADPWVDERIRLQHRLSPSCSRSDGKERAAVAKLPRLSGTSAT